MKSKSLKKARSLGILDYGLLLVAGVLFFIGLGIAFPTLATLISGGYGNLIDYGNAGSYIGGVVGSLWSFSGIVLFFIAIRLQKKELELQIQELKETKETFQQQNFETTFFNLLNRQNQILNNIEYDYSPKIDLPNMFDKNKNGLAFFVNSKEAFRALYDYFKTESPFTREIARTRWSFYDFDKSSLELLGQEINSETPENEFTKKLYLFFMDQYYQQYGHYMRHFYNIIKYVRSYQNILPDEKIAQYISLVKSQISVSELFFIFYNGYAFPKMKDMIDEFNLIEHLPEKELLNPSHVEFFKSKPRKNWSRFAE